MRAEKLQISAGAALAACFVYFAGAAETVAAAGLSVAVHELGHLAVLRLLGLRLTGLRLELRGLCMEYAGAPGPFEDILGAAAGPAAGFLLAGLLSAPWFPATAPWLRLTAGMSLLLSMFNLLPALPLDGGRIFRALAVTLFGERAGGALSAAVSIAVGLLLTALGLWLALEGRGAAALAAGLWILLAQSES